MSNPLKKTMVFLGLAEDDYDEITGEIDTSSYEEISTPARQERAHVTPLRRVTPVQSSVGSMNEIVTVHPTEYKDAQPVAESFRSGVPVILNLSRMTESDARRMIDFASGLAMGLRGKIERVTNKVFLLSPEHIAISNESEAAEGQDESFFLNRQ